MLVTLLRGVALRAASSASALMLARGGDGKMRLPFGVFLALGAIGGVVLRAIRSSRAYRALWP